MHIDLSTLDGRWSLKRCIAVVTPGLCCQLVLGLPFLSHNCVVLDMFLHTAFPGKSSIDILYSNPCLPVLPSTNDVVVPAISCDELKKHKRQQ